MCFILAVPNFARFHRCNVDGTKTFIPSVYPKATPLPSSNRFSCSETGQWSLAKSNCGKTLNTKPLLGFRVG